MLNEDEYLDICGFIGDENEKWVSSTDFSIFTLMQNEDEYLDICGFSRDENEKWVSSKDFSVFTLMQIEDEYLDICGFVWEENDSSTDISDILKYLCFVVERTEEWVPSTDISVFTSTENED